MWCNCQIIPLPYGGERQSSIAWNKVDTFTLCHAWLHVLSRRLWCDLVVMCLLYFKQYCTLIKPVGYKNWAIPDDWQHLYYTVTPERCLIPHEIPLLCVLVEIALVISRYFTVFIFNSFLYWGSFRMYTERFFWTFQSTFSSLSHNHYFTMSYYFPYFYSTIYHKILWAERSSLNGWGSSPPSWNSPYHQ